MEIRPLPVQGDRDSGAFTLVDRSAQMNQKTLDVSPSQIRRPRKMPHRFKSFLVLPHRSMMALFDGIVKFSWIFGWVVRPEKQHSCCIERISNTAARMGSRYKESRARPSTNRRYCPCWRCSSRELRRWSEASRSRWRRRSFRRNRSIRRRCCRSTEAGNR